MRRRCGLADCSIDREARMVRLAAGGCCDPCIADLVAALNAGGLRTVASCCGHGYRPWYLMASWAYQWCDQPIKSPTGCSIASAASSTRSGTLSSTGIAS